MVFHFGFIFIEHFRYSLQISSLQSISNHTEVVSMQVQIWSANFWPIFASGIHCKRKILSVDKNYTALFGKEVHNFKISAVN